MNSTFKNVLGGAVIFTIASVVLTGGFGFITADLLRFAISAAVAGGLNFVYNKYINN